VPVGKLDLGTESEVLGTKKVDLGCGRVEAGFGLRICRCGWWDPDTGGTPMIRWARRRRWGCLFQVVFDALVLAQLF
jgi:hypothetical protein